MKKYLILLVICVMLIPTHVFAMADSAECACVISALTGEVIFEKNAHERRPMASTTKIMTAITAIENSSVDESVKISRNADMQEGSSAYVDAGSEMLMGDLLYGLMLNSGNDAAMAIAEHIAGSSEEFARLMNKKALEIGADDTSFVNPSGLDDELHYTTAHNLALIARCAMKNPQFREIVSTKSVLKHPVGSDKELWFINHNKLLGRYEGCIGIKTGYTKTAGRCFVSAAERDGMTFIAVTLNDPNDWSNHEKMLDYAFDRCSAKEIVAKGQCMKTVSAGGKKYELKAAESFTVPFVQGETREINIKTHFMSDLAPPINAGEKVGYMEILYNGEKIGSVDINSEEDIYSSDSFKLKNSFCGVFMSILKLWCI